MACITTVAGTGGNCNTGGSKNNYGVYTFPGYWVPVPHSVCGYTWTSLAKNGVKHPDANNWSFSTYAFSYSGCEPDPNKPCDCINGGCVPATMYDTPGLFPKLADCQSGCAPDSDCEGECVSSAEILTLQQSIGNLQSKICK